MAIARKCDRCGAYYDTPASSALCGFQWMTGTGPTKLIDLCADCASELSDWMEDKAEPEAPPKPEPEKIPYEKPVIGDSVEEVTTKGFVSLLEEVEPEEQGSEVVTSKPDKPVTDVETIVKERLSGKKSKQIAKEYGLKPNTVANYIAVFKAKNPDRYAELEQSAKNR